MSQIVGIDLGTTHCAVASVDPSRGRDAPVVDLPIPQVLRPGEQAPRPLLPSMLYAPATGELDPALARLPWSESPTWIAGEFARWQGARVPGRLVSSAKSWLCHPGVDRAAEILPWGGAPDAPRLSPVDASALLLRHLRQAWEWANPDHPLAEQEVVLTVPASFDDSARALTVTAARRAGLERFTLVEEPQAAFYDFTARHRASLEQALRDVRLVLVVDVGGGTTDLTLVHAGVSPEGPLLRRIAVGEHLLLGGDNMDAAIARRAEERSGRKFTAAQWTQLVQAARSAKETLLGGDAPERYTISIASGGAKLIGGTISVELAREELASLLLEGFFPLEGPDALPRRAARTGLQELGLPYAQDAAITRHLAAFLRQHAQTAFDALGERPAAPGALPRPDAILLNGGVFNSPRLADRLVDALSRWWPDAPRIPLLKHGSLDLAVARGAAYYGLVRRGLGLKIGGGAARAYYVGLSGPEPQALCLVPRGFEEGQTAEISQRSFTLTLGRPVQFALYTTTADRVDVPGDVVPVTEELTLLPPLHALLTSAKGGPPERRVHLEAKLTEIGTLELWCLTADRSEQWRLEFAVRGGGSAGRVAVTESMPPRFAEASELVGRVYGNKPLPLGPKDVKQLFKNVEKVLGPKETWRVPVLRELWSTLMSGASKRRRSADHERVFFQLAGFSLRPGFGYPLDDWRAAQTFALFKDAVQFHGEKANWNEFWVLWRRVAGGLDEQAQHALWDYLQPHLAERVPPDAPKPAARRKGVQPEGTDEMVRTAASLEHLDAGEKERLGGWMAARLSEPVRGGAAGPPTRAVCVWALGRLGARVPLYGSGHRTVRPDTAEAWLELLLRHGLGLADAAPFAAVQLARRTGDRTRDVDEPIRMRVREALATARAPDHWLRLLDEVVELSAADEARALGDTLPAGLALG